MDPLVRIQLSRSCSLSTNQHATYILTFSPLWVLACVVFCSEFPDWRSLSSDRLLCICVRQLDMGVTSTLLTTGAYLLLWSNGYSRRPALQVLPNFLSFPHNVMKSMTHNLGPSDNFLQFIYKSDAYD